MIIIASFFYRLSFFKWEIGSWNLLILRAIELPLASIKPTAAWRCFYVLYSLRLTHSTTFSCKEWDCSSHLVSNLFWCGSPSGSVLLSCNLFFFRARARWQSWARRSLFDAVEVPRNLFFCCWESLPRNVSQSLEGVVSPIWLWNQNPWLFHASRYLMKSECWPFHIESQPFPSFLGIKLQGTSLKTDASCQSLDCSFGLIKAGALDKQEANLVILEDDSLKQSFHKQVHDTDFQAPKKTETDPTHFHWLVSDSCQVRRMTEETKSTLVTWEKFDPPLWGKRWDALPLFTHKSLRTRGVDNVSLTAWLSAFFLDPTSLLWSTYLLLVLGSGYPPFFKAFYSSEERNLHCLFVCPNEWEVCGESPDFSFSCLFRQNSGLSVPFCSLSLPLLT